MIAPVLFGAYLGIALLYFIHGLPRLTQHAVDQGAPKALTWVTLSINALLWPAALAAVVAILWVRRR